MLASEIIIKIFMFYSLFRKHRLMHFFFFFFGNVRRELDADEVPVRRIFSLSLPGTNWNVYRDWSAWLHDLIQRVETPR